MIAGMWVVEVRTMRGRWTVGETVSLRPAVYRCRADARRALYNLEIAAWWRDRRIRRYVPQNGVNGR